MVSAFIFLCAFVVALSPLQAAAYIDPGTGATFLGAMGPLIVGFIAAGSAFCVKVFWHPLKRLFARSKEQDAQ